MNKFKAKIQELKKEAQKKSELENINSDWIKNKMEFLGLSQQTLQDDLQIDKSSISLLLSGKQNLSKRTKAAFFYYLAYKEQCKINTGLLIEK